MEVVKKTVMIILLVILGLSIKWPLKLVTGVLNTLTRILNGIVKVIEDEVLNLS